MSERGQDFDAKREAYLLAVDERDYLVNHPDKTAPVHEYRGKLAMAGLHVDMAHKDMMTAWATNRTQHGNH